MQILILHPTCLLSPSLRKLYQMFLCQIILISTLHQKYWLQRTPMKVFYVHCLLVTKEISHRLDLACKVTENLRVEEITSSSVMRKRTHSVHLPPPSFWWGGGGGWGGGRGGWGWTSNFSRRGEGVDRISIFRRGLLGKREWYFPGRFAIFT